MIVPVFDMRNTFGFLLCCGKLYVPQVEIGGGMYKSGPVGVRSKNMKDQ